MKTIEKSRAIKAGSRKTFFFLDNFTLIYPKINFYPLFGCTRLLLYIFIHISNLPKILTPYLILFPRHNYLVSKRCYEQVSFSLFRVITLGSKSESRVLLNLVAISTIFLSEIWFRFSSICQKNL